MIKGVGTDIVQLSRVSESLEATGGALARRILTTTELAEFEASRRPVIYLAKRFAAKEAISKALGTGIGRGVSFQHIEIIHDDYGRPLVVLTGGAADRLQFLGASDCLISIADEVDYASAFAIIQ